MEWCRVIVLRRDLKGRECYQQEVYDMRLWYPLYPPCMTFYTRVSVAVYQFERTYSIINKIFRSNTKKLRSAQNTLQWLLWKSHSFDTLRKNTLCNYLILRITVNYCIQRIHKYLVHKINPVDYFLHVKISNNVPMVKVTLNLFYFVTNFYGDLWKTVVCENTKSTHSSYAISSDSLAGWIRDACWA